MKAMKRLTALVLMLCILLAALPVTASAVTASGSCGPSLTWSLNNSGTLTISGNGVMYDYEWGGAPWYEYIGSINKVVINSGAIYIGCAAFIDCYYLTSVTIPNTVVQIGPAAFAYCESLTGLTIPSSVTIIGATAFTYSGLTSIKIPAKVAEIGEYAFMGCISLSKIEVDRNNSRYHTDSSGVLYTQNKTVLVQAPCNLSGSYTITGQTIKIAGGAFLGCTKLTQVSVPGYLTEIGDYAFQACTSLKRIDVSSSNNTYSSDNGVLFNKDKTELLQAPGGLTGKYTIPGKVFSVGQYAFMGCVNLTGIVIPDNVYAIYDGAFSYCESLTSISIGRNVDHIGESVFAGCTSLRSITIPDNINYIGPYMFSGCTALSNIDFPVSLFEIGEGAFAGCNALKTITIPDTVSSIGVAAFDSCIGLTSAIVGSNAHRIGDYVFYGCENLSRVQLKEGVLEISEGAFMGCSNLTNIEVPASLQKINQSAFDGCNMLSIVFYGGKTSDKDGIVHYGDADIFLDATWHYECVELQGTYPAYYCGECNKCYFLDNSESHFTDVLTNGWQFTFAKYAVDNDLMAGIGTDNYGRVTFLPDSAITREQFVQVLYNAEGKPPVSSEKQFPDVAEGTWYEYAVLWAYENNIASGMGNGDFGIGKNITRQDLALMLYKYASQKGYSLDATNGKIYQYADGDIVSDYAKTAMDWAVTNGILSGKGTAGEPLSTFRLDPAGTATRAECAAMLRNFMTAFASQAFVEPAPWPPIEY